MTEKRACLYSKDVLLLFLQLIRKEMMIFFGELKGKWFQAAISTITMFIIFEYLMPEMGLNADYSLFMIMGIVASFGFYEMVGRIAAFISDLNGDRVISNLLILPLPSFLSISSIAIGWASTGFCLTLLLFPVAKILLQTSWDLSQLSPVKFLGMIISINILFGYFALWLASLIKNVKNTGWIWIMIINPLYMLGCYYCPWEVSYRISSYLGWINLLNPMTYVMEGIRSTTLGPVGFLPYSYCLAAIWTFTIVFAWRAYTRLKKRLDFI